MDTTRVSDADRERTSEHLRRAVGEGRLTLGEVDERLRTAGAAVTRADLAAVTADLPATPRPAPPVPVTTAVRPPSVWTEEWKGWLGGSLLMVAIWIATSVVSGHLLPFWPAFPVGIWAAVLVTSMLTGRRPGHGCGR